MKCKNCGKEFEGNFCPMCGTKAVPACPVCGKEKAEGALYCSNCGHRFGDPIEAKPQPAAAPAPVEVKPQPAIVPAPAPKEEAPKATLGKIYGILFHVPAIALLLLGLLAIIVLAMPFAVEGFEGIVEESLSGFAAMGSGETAEYFSLFYELSLVGNAAAILVFAIIALLFGGFYLYWTLKLNADRKCTLVAGKNIAFTTVFAAAGGAIDLILFIIVCATMGKISSAGEGFLSSGSGLTLLLVFCIILGILLAAPAIQWFLRKKFPGIEGEIQTAQEAKPEKNKPEKPKAVYEGSEPVEPQKIEKPKLDRKSPEGLINRLSRKRRRILAVVLLGIAAGIVFPGLFLGIENFWTLYNGVAILVIVLFAFLLVGAYVLIGTHRLTKWKESSSRHNRLVTLLAVLVFIAVLALAGGIVACFVAGFMQGWDAIDFFEPLMVFGAAFVVVLCLFIYLVKVKKLAKKVRVALYGKAKVKKGEPLVLTFADIAKPYTDYLAYRKAYGEYRYLRKCFEKNKKASEKIQKVSGFKPGRYIVPCVYAIGAAALVCAIGVQAVAANDIFTVARVSSITWNDYKDDVREILGDPDIEEDYVWYYYEDTYTDLLEDMENAIFEYGFFSDEYQSLLDELGNLVYKSIEVDFDTSKNASNPPLVSVWLDMNDGAGSSEEKILSEFYIYGASTIYTYYAKIYYRVSFEDGSYGENTINVEPTESNGTSVYRWSDRWGSYEVTAADLA